MSYENETKKVLIIGRNIHPDGKETAQLIANALKPHLKKHDIQTDLVLLKDIVFDISNDLVSITDAASGTELREYDAVLMTNWFSHASVRKDMALALALYFEHHNVPCMNSEARHSRSTSKLSQMIIAAYNDVPIARTIFSLKLQHTLAHMKQVSFVVPFIFKDAQASRGKGNFLLDSTEQILDHKAEHSEKHPFMVQERIVSDNSDYRFFVAGGKTRAVIKRSATGESHLNNTSAGGVSEVVSVDSFDTKVLDIVHRMSKLLHREVTGVDIMFDKNTGLPYFLEANPIPQIATGSNVPVKLEALATALVEAAKGGQ